jgi:hypothetical protein
MFIFSSCSFLIKESVLISKSSENWKKTLTCQHVEGLSRICTYNYKYSTCTIDSLSISIGPSLYGFTITWGPPLVPILPSPNLFISPEWKNHPFYVDLLFQNFRSKILDLNSIDFIFNKQNSKYEPDSVYLLSNTTMRFDGEIGVHRITNNSYFIECDTTRIRFFFNVRRDKVNGLSIDFSNLQLDDTITSFPIINYTKKSRFLYNPFFIDI